MTAQPDHADDFDAIVVGAGFGGLYMLYRLLQLGLRVRVFEAGSGVGGTWYWNRYPGARCDVESLEYSYSFSDDCSNSGSGPSGMRRNRKFCDTWNMWRTDSNSGNTYSSTPESSNWCLMKRPACGRSMQTALTVRARFCIMATGCLSAANVPEIPGLDSFRGEIYHTGRWPHHDVDFTGKRVGIIGTGSSAVQSIPIIATQADHLYVFQRTPNFSVPARNHPLDPDVQVRMKADYARFRRQQRATAFAAGLPARAQSALQATPEELEQHYDERWRHGGLTFIGAFADSVV